MWCLSKGAKKKGRTNAPLTFKIGIHLFALFSFIPINPITIPRPFYRFSFGMERKRERQKLWEGEKGANAEKTGAVGLFGLLEKCFFLPFVLFTNPKRRGTVMQKRDRHRKSLKYTAGWMGWEGGTANAMRVGLLIMVGVWVSLSVCLSACLFVREKMNRSSA